MIGVIPNAQIALYMTDIFISYSRHDQQWVAKLAKALEDVGYSVWWDTQLLAGQNFQNTIPAVLDKARCAIVVWSNVSVGREWVQAEAYRANERKVLVPLRIDPVRIPLPFNMLHTEDMQKWNGKPDHPAFQRLLQAVAQHCPPPVIDHPADDEPKPKPEPKPNPPSPKRPITGWLMAAGVATAVAVGVFLLADKLPGKQPTIPPAVAATAEPPPEPVKSDPQPAPPREPTLEEKLNRVETWLTSDDKTQWAQAVKQLEALSAAGSAEASYILGGLYYVGSNGVNQDTDKGCGWYQKAAKAGHQQAKDIYAKLSCK